MTIEEKEVFLNVLKDLKLPEGFSSNISRLVNVRDKKIVGMKSHEYHVLMQQLLALGLRKAISKPIAKVLSELCTFFKVICEKVIDVKKVEQMEHAIPIILCKLEKYFPPAFFNGMVHLIIHLPQEVKKAGPVNFRWVYPIERYLLKLKGYIRNKINQRVPLLKGI